MVNEDNILALPFLRGHLSTYSANPNEPMAASPQSMGQSTLLVTGVQARNNARAVFSGSLYLFSDAAFARKVSPLYLSSTSISGNKVTPQPLYTAIAAIHLTRTTGIRRICYSLGIPAARSYPH